MPEKNKEPIEVYCSCENCRVPMGGYHRNLAIRLLLGLLIMFIMFYVGFKLGEFKGSIESGMGYKMFGPHHDMFYVNDGAGTFNKMTLPMDKATTPATGQSSGSSTK